MFRQPTPSAGFTVAAHDERATHGHTLAFLLATVSLFLSTAILLTVMVSSARAANLF